MAEVTSSWAEAACGSKSAAASSPQSAGKPTAFSSLYHMSRIPWILYLVCAAGAGFKSVGTPLGLEAATHAS